MTRSQLILKIITGLHIRRRDLIISPMTPNEPQLKIWEKFAPRIDRKQKLWAIILKARREGVSTFLEGMMTARTFLDENLNAKVIAHMAPATEKIFEIAKLMVEKSSILKGLGHIAGHSIQFGQSILEVTTAGSEHATRGQDITCLHASEVGFWERPEAWLAILQCVPDQFDSWVFMESTANGKTGHGKLFYDEWKRAEAGDSDLMPVFLPWYIMSEYDMPGKSVSDHPDYRDEEEILISEFGVRPSQLAWRRWAIQNKCQGDIEKFHQEYPSFPEEAFIASGLPFFTTAQLAPIRKNVYQGEKFIIQTKFTRDPHGYLEIWKKPEQGHDYVIGADSSFGFDDMDHSKSTFEVLDMETMEQVAEYEAPSAPHVLAKHLAMAGRYYNNALIAPEVQASGGGGGREIIVYLRKDHNYHRLHQWKHGDKLGQENPHLVGWETTSRTRPRMIARLREVIMERSVTIHSSKLLDQLSNFGENESGRLEAIEGHDDLIFAYGIALMSRSENYVAKRYELPPVDEMYDDLKIRTVADTSKLFERHMNMVLKGQKAGAEKDSWLKY